MKSPNNGRDSTPNDHLLLPNEVSSVGTTLHVTELLQLGKEFSQEPPRQPRLLSRLYAALHKMRERPHC